MLLKKQSWFIGNSLFLDLIILLSTCFSQQDIAKKDQYILSEDQKLQIVVHIWGEINRPGQYIVPDGTDVRELISIAGGPTEYSNLRNIKLTREYLDNLKTQQHFNKSNDRLIKKKLITINLKKYLERELSEPIPILQPGDVVKINRNLWSRWQTLIRVVSQVAIVIQAMYFYSRIE